VVLVKHHPGEVGCAFGGRREEPDGGVVRVVDVKVVTIGPAIDDYAVVRAQGVGVFDQLL
jgi:hypothetical protein